MSRKWISTAADCFCFCVAPECCRRTTEIPSIASVASMRFMRFYHRSCRHWQYDGFCCAPATIPATAKQKTIAAVEIHFLDMGLPPFSVQVIIYPFSLKGRLQSLWFTC